MYYYELIIFLANTSYKYFLSICSKAHHKSAQHALNTSKPLYVIVLNSKFNISNVFVSLYFIFCAFEPVLSCLVYYNT